ncbi:MAG: hypothetical protein HYX63_02210 [Gammaproteobacteria bacterium]|nr:hypothetical protein [Gammaproteobacteria bacterium]
MNQVLPPPRSRLLRVLAAAIIANGFLASSASAATFHLLTSPSLSGHVTFDAFLGNADDQVFNGINTIGAASQFSVMGGIYGFVQGSFTTQGQSIFGLQGQQLFGSNVFKSENLSGQWNLNSASLFNQAFTQTLAATPPNALTINHDQTYTDSFVLNDTLAQGNVQFAGTGQYLLRNQNAAALYSGSVLTHFNLVTPLLPSDWTGVAQESQTFKILTGPNAGLTGFATVTLTAR